MQISSPIISKLISYPKLDLYEYHKRISDLYKIGVKDAILEGPTRLCELNILGKGHSGIVLKVNGYSEKNMALKIRRLDSRRKDSLNEVNNQKLKTQFIGKNLIHFERLNSTNDFACEIEKKFTLNEINI